MNIFSYSLKLVLAIALLASIFSCSSDKDDGKTSLGYVSTGLTGLAVQIMKDNKIPEKYGLDLSYSGFPNPTSSNNSFVLGKYDINIAAGSNVVAVARSKGFDVTYFHPTLLNSVSLIVKRDSNYQKLKDLVGKKIGWYGLSSGGGTAFYLLGREEELSINDDFQLSQVSPPMLWPMLEKQEFDAIIIFEPFVSKMLSTGEYRVILGPFWREWEKYHDAPMEMAGLAASDSWLNENREIAMKMVKVWEEVVKIIKSDPKGLVSKYSELLGLKKESEIQMASSNLPKLFVERWGEMESSIETTLKILQKDRVLIERPVQGVLTPIISETN